MDNERLDALYIRLEKMEKRLEEICLLSKEALTFEEAWKFLRVSSSQLYKMVFKRILPVFKPGGKLLYFKRRDLENWMLSNRKQTDKEQTAQALNMLDKKQD